MQPPATTPRINAPRLGDDGFVVEGLVTTVGVDGRVNIAPMGPIVDADWQSLLFRPFPGSQTHANLLRDGQGVFHVTDDVELIAATALGSAPSPQSLEALPDGKGFVLTDACRWYAFEIIDRRVGSDRPEWLAQVTQRRFLREFIGFNRAKAAVVELTILATRKDRLARNAIEAALQSLEPTVRKTGSAAELRAWKFVCDYLSEPTP
ncbi:MAG: DUF447 family protein [Planctomycetales bacterium]|nr:DUF447 family protein [Planctomycetales bacterium]